MRSKCWPSIYNCQIHNHRGAGSSRSTSARIPSLADVATSGSAMTGKRISDAGSGLIRLGIAQYAAAHLSQPPSAGKIWMHSTRKEAKIHHPDIPKKDYHKYDWQPKGTSVRGSFRDANTRWYKSHRGQRAEHYRRRPVRGIYSQPSPSETRAHRAKQRRKGISKAGIGAGMKALGNGLMIVQLGQYSYWLYNDPSDATLGRIAKDFAMVDNINFVVDQFDNWLQDIDIIPHDIQRSG